jgi:hypothetical protein
LENQWQKSSRKRHRNLDDQEYRNAKKEDYRLGGTITTTNRFNTIAEEYKEEEAKRSTEPKPPPILISGVKNIKPLIELHNETAKDKYLVKTLHNDQVILQPTGRSVYNSIVKALMEKKYRISHLQAKEGTKL